MRKEVPQNNAGGPEHTKETAAVHAAVSLFL